MIIDKVNDEPTDFDHMLDDVDRRIVAALQRDGRVSAERLGEVLGFSVATARRRLNNLLANGAVRVSAAAPIPLTVHAMLLRVHVSQGKVDAVAEALVRRPDIALVDVSAGGDEILAILLAGPGPGNRLIFRQLPATTAVAAVEARTVIHVFANASDWRLDALTETEQAALTPPAVAPEPREFDQLETDIAAALTTDGRASASAVAARIKHPESTVRRRMAALFDEGHLVTSAMINPALLGLTVDANLWLRVPPAHLDTVGRALGKHPAVHGALATTGPANLHLAVWLRDLDHLYQFITTELADYPINDIDTVLVGRALKRPGG